MGCLQNASTAETLAEAAHAGLDASSARSRAGIRRQVGPTIFTSLASPARKVHFIGICNRTSSTRAAEIFSAIDSVDLFFDLPERLNDAAGKAGKKTADPARRSQNQAGSRPNFRHRTRQRGAAAPARNGCHSPTLTMHGLMTIAPFDDKPGDRGACFRRLRSLRDTLAREYPGIDSMSSPWACRGTSRSPLRRLGPWCASGPRCFGERPQAR